MSKSGASILRISTGVDVVVCEDLTGVRIEREDCSFLESLFEGLGVVACLGTSFAFAFALPADLWTSFFFKLSLVGPTSTVFFLEESTRWLLAVTLFARGLPRSLLLLVNRVFVPSWSRFWHVFWRALQVLMSSLRSMSPRCHRPRSEVRVVHSNSVVRFHRVGRT